MAFIDAEQAKEVARECIWGQRRNEFDDVWESPEERAQMSEWMLRWYEQEYPWRIAEPEEVPCGWLMRVAPQEGWQFIGGYNNLLINGWTGEVIELHRAYFTPEFYIRRYIEQLPEDQRAAAMNRWDLMPFEPMRFFPCVLQVSVAQREARTPFPLTVEFDDKYFAQQNLPIPELKAVQFFHDKVNRDLHLRSRIGALTRNEESHRNGKTLIDYVFTAPLTLDDIPTHLEPRGEIHAIRPDLPQNVEDTLPDELRYAMSLWVEIGSTPRL